MKRWAFALVLIALIAMLASAASAQYESADKSLLGIRAGFFMPSGSHLSDLKSIWLCPSLDFNIKHDQLDKPSLIASIGWMEQDGSAGAGRIIPMTLSFVKRSAKSENSSIYFGGGVGYYSSKYTGAFRNPLNENRLELFSVSGGKFGLHLLGGYEFGGSWFAELRYDRIGELSHPVAGSVDFSGISLCLGSRFGY